MTITILESDMSFGPFNKNDAFEIEKSETYKKVSHGIKIIEFAVIMRPENSPIAVWLVEAKKSTPKPGTKPNFEEFINDIQEKLTNGLQLIFSACLLRHPQTALEIPQGFIDLTLREKFKLILVINGHQDAWLPPIQDALNTALQPIVKTFGLESNSVAVLNDVRARRFGLIT